MIIFWSFSDAFAKITKAPVRHVNLTSVEMSVGLFVCRPICLSKTLWTDFREIWFLKTFTKICQDAPYLFKMGQKCCAICVKTFSLLTSTIQNIMYLDNSAKITHCCISISALNTFILLTAECRSTTVQVINRVVWVSMTIAVRL